MVIKPSFALAAPHTTFFSSFSPTLTSQTFNLSALGCFTIFKIFSQIVRVSVKFANFY